MRFKTIAKKLSSESSTLLMLMIRVLNFSSQELEAGADANFKHVNRIGGGTIGRHCYCGTIVIDSIFFFLVVFLVSI